MIPHCKASCCFWISFILFSLASCEKTYGIESSFGIETTISIGVGQAAYSPREQDVIVEAIQMRRQISDVTVYNNVCTVTFQGGKTAHLRFDIFPYISTEDGESWKLNGDETGLPVCLDENGGVVIPVLTPGHDLWYLENYESSTTTRPYWEYSSENTSTHVAGLMEYENRLFIYKSDGTVDAIPIIKEGFYRVPEYWIGHLVEKEKKAEAAIAEADNDCAAFVFLTDTHWGKNMKKSPALIRHIMDFTPFEDVVFGGDVITTHSTNLVAPMELGRDFQASFAFLGTRFHCLYGNHDNNSDSQQRKTEYHLSEEQVYSWLQSQMTDVVYGDYYNFYYDNPSAKTRIICLDTGRYYYSLFWGTLPNTVQFAVDALNSLPDGWHAIMASHIWCLNKKQSDGSYIQYIGDFVQPILKVFDDYNARLSGTYEYKGESVPYDFANSRGSIEFCIGGHTHIEYTTESEGGIPIIITYSDYAKTPQPGTDQEQSVTMVVADYKNHQLKLFVVGRGSDRTIDL